MTAAHLQPESALFSARGLCKSFGSVEVLHGIDLTLHRGEVHALLGENGAGKSTLVKILCGFEAASAGELAIADANGTLQEVASWNQQVAESQGVVLIHQEFNLAEQLTVVENIFLGNELTRGPFLDKAKMRAQATEYLRTLNCELPLDRPVSELAVSDKQMVEIAKVQSRSLRVLILDEPTAVLTQNESATLFALLKRLQADGVAIVYISHKLDEIKAIADRVTVLRDGAVVGTADTRDLSKDDMIRMMVGRELSSLFPPIQDLPPGQPVALTVTNLPLKSGECANFELRTGEILGFAGLVGSGRTALMETLVGLERPRTSGHGMRIGNQDVRLANLSDARDHGIAYLTKDRKGKGLLLNTGLTANFSLFTLSQFGRVLIDRRQEQAAFDVAVETFDIRFKDSAITAGNLSGGNQQKLLLAKIMAANPSILIIDEPTRGIDVGTKSQIYHFIAQLVAEGLAVILISSDISEIIGLSHRVAVMYHDRLAGILEGSDINEEEIMRYATGEKMAPVPTQQPEGRLQRVSY